MMHVHKWEKWQRALSQRGIWAIHAQQVNVQVRECAKCGKMKVRNLR